MDCLPRLGCSRARTERRAKRQVETTARVTEIHVKMGMYAHRCISVLTPTAATWTLVELQVPQHTGTRSLPLSAGC